MKQIKHKDKSFEKWLNEELDKPCEYEHYDPTGNSTRAMVARYRESKLNSLMWHYKDLYGDLLYGWKNFNLSTEIGQVFGLIIFTLLFPLGGVLRLYFDTRRHIEDYYKDYKAKKEKS